DAHGISYELLMETRACPAARCAQRSGRDAGVQVARETCRNSFSDRLPSHGWLPRKRACRRELILICLPRRRLPPSGFAAKALHFDERHCRERIAAAPPAG